jgi:23S rRNA pseudouridine1911/1915/1917 synthase
MSEDESEEFSDGSETLRVVIGPEQAGQRLDKALGLLCEGVSRSRIQGLIEEGRVSVNGQARTNASAKALEGDEVEIDVPAPVEAVPRPEKIALDVVYEDDDLIVINKPVGLVVHPGAGNYSGTLVNALLHHCAGGLSGIGGVMRPGIVHRLDKETSGLMVAAKNDFAHRGLSAQLEDRSLSRIYAALVLKVPVPLKGLVDMPIGRDPAHRLKMSVRGRAGRPARTHYHVEQRFGEQAALVRCALESGRTHQIRVHMAAIKHPLIGDPLYGPQPTALRSAMVKLGLEAAALEQVLAFPRQALHAQEISFIHPASGEEMQFEAPWPEDMVKLLKLLDL